MLTSTHALMQDPGSMLRDATPRSRHYEALTRLGRFLPRRRGLRKLTRALGAIFGRTAITLHHEAGFDFRFRLDDPYWTPLLFADYDYEPEIAHAIETSDAEVFVDAGANKGYWTACALTRFNKVISVEASPTTYRELLQNARGAETLNAAVYSESGYSFELIRSEVRHGHAYLRHLAPAWKDRIPDDRVEMVDTVTLDELVERGKKVLVKLDVEGAEIEALKGAERILQEGATILFEEHAKDRTCSVTRYLMNRGLEIRYYDRQLKTCEEVLAVKKQLSKGYNFTATRLETSTDA